MLDKIINIALLSTCLFVFTILSYSCGDHNKSYIGYVSTDICLLIHKNTLPYNHFASQYNIKGFDLILLIVLDSSCINSALEIVFWRDIISNWDRADNLGIVFMLRGNIDLYLVHIILDKDIIEIPVYHDNNNYITNNHIELIDYGNVLLADNKNKILFIGKPYHNAKDLNKLFHIIKRAP
jgi:hypothetical protein